MERNIMCLARIGFGYIFLENSGMAWGFKFGDGYLAKVVLILFRLAAIIWGTFYINKMIKKGYAKFFNQCSIYIRWCAGQFD